MYDLRGTRYDDGRQSLPMYDVRGTMYDLESERALRGEAVCLAFYTLRNGLNEEGEDFMGARVV